MLQIFANNYNFGGRNILAKKILINSIDFSEHLRENKKDNKENSLEKTREVPQ